MTNRSYWMRRHGSDYKAQQDRRRGKPGAAYDVQEAVILQRVKQLVAERGHLDVLDFGCGFGRISMQLAEVEGVRVYAFDLSDNMVAPLRGAAEVGEAPGVQVEVGASICDAFPGATFDLIVSVSVFIHNPPEDARAIFLALLARLREDGLMLLIENPVACVSFKHSLWHDGCWVHDVAGDIAKGNRIVIDTFAVPGHALYEVSHPRFGPDVLFRDEEGQERSITRAELVLYGFDSVVQSIRELELELEQTSALRTDGLEHDLQEIAPELNQIIGALCGFAATEADIASSPTQLGAVLRDVLRRMEALEDEVASVSAERDALRQRVEHLRGASVRLTRIRSALSGDKEFVDVERTGVGSSMAAESGDAVQYTAEPLFDEPRDKRYENDLPGFDDVCHVFNKQWFGMRAAAGALPGHKLAISAEHEPTAEAVAKVAEEVRSRGITRLVMHGFSRPMEMWARGFAACDVADLYLVWHGAPAMWVWEAERQLFGSVRDLALRGVFKRVHIMRGGNHHLLGERGWAPQLLNMPPKLPGSLKDARSDQPEERVALCPSWNLLHKNVFTNVAAALATQGISRVWVLADDVSVPWDSRIDVLPTLDQRAMLETMRLADVVTNVSLVDCHPMVELEALAVRTPCLRSRLHLGVLEQHPYVRLTEVDNALSVDAVRERMEAVIEVPRKEIVEIMGDYHRAVIKCSAEQYQDFLRG